MTEQQTATAVIVITFSTVLAMGVIAKASAATIITAFGAVTVWLLLCAAIIVAISELHLRRR